LPYRYIQYKKTAVLGFMYTRLEYGSYTMPPDVPRIFLKYQNMDGSVCVSAEESLKVRGR
jgi:hypothetical protein